MFVLFATMLHFKSTNPMSKTTLLLLTTLLIAHQSILGQSALFNISRAEISIDYQSSSPLSKYRYDSASYELARTQDDYVFESFDYTSDGLTVDGLLCRPKNSGNVKWPVIIYNRGGTGNFGKLTEEDLPDFYALAKHGFVVFASNYRYVGKRGPFDQIGGDDINDVINLYESIKELDYIDKDKVFMMGVSRGGIMTYKSLTKININAAAVVGGVADYHELAKERPIFLSGWSDLDEENNYKGLENIIPDFNEKKSEHLSSRSAVDWADQINTPILILHSRQDGRVPVNGALRMALKLSEQNKPYKLKVYDRKSHSLPYSKFDSFDEIIEWFKLHMN